MRCAQLGATSSSLGLRANITSSIKPEIYSISQRHQRRTEPRPQVTRTGVNPAGDAGDTSPNILVGGTSTGISRPILLRTFGYSRPILVALRSLSLKPFSFSYKTPPIRFSQAGGQSAHKARPPNLELALTPLVTCTKIW